MQTAGLVHTPTRPGNGRMLSPRPSRLGNPLAFRVRRAGWRRSTANTSARVTGKFSPRSTHITRARTRSSEGPTIDTTGLSPNARAQPRSWRPGAGGPRPEGSEDSVWSPSRHRPMPAASFYCQTSAAVRRQPSSCRSPGVRQAPTPGHYSTTRRQPLRPPSHYHRPAPAPPRRRDQVRHRWRAASPS
jgi:hypothetical protein